MTIHSGAVGLGSFEKKATYALVDVRNPTSFDLAVTMTGTFVDSAKQEVGKMLRPMLRIPAGGLRTFALVEDQSQGTPIAGRATGASIEVTSAVKLKYQEETSITDFHEYKHQGTVVVKGFAQNRVARICKVIIFATFYDKDDRPIARPSALFQLERHARRGVEFTGPDGSVRGTLSVGDIVY